MFDIREPLDLETELFECGFWIVLHLSQGMSANISVVGSVEATDPCQHFIYSGMMALNSAISCRGLTIPV
ncbi:unnamed protein product [Toxocara canis]|uniref:RNase_PH domain-containing protein n=1 Tax=Toxocara canis TaxID=6265 RepID=A0A183U619_TOXCA|nr:unnamed protein product [Toxocara canis]